MRGEFFKLRGQTYVQAARASGLGSIRIFMGQILPNALTPLITILPFTSDCRHQFAHSSGFPGLWSTAPYPLLGRAASAGYG